MAFKLYQNPPHGGAKPIDRLTVRKSGVLGLGTQLCKEHDIVNYDYVELYYDSDTDRIGLKFLKKHEKKYGTAKIYYNRKSCIIACMVFLRDFCGLDLPGVDYGRLPIISDHGFDMLVAGPLSEIRNTK